MSVLYLNAAAGIAKSPNVWRTFPRSDEIRLGRIALFEDHFINIQDVAAAETETTSGYGAIVGTGCTIAPLATERNGVIRLSHDGSNDDEVGLQVGHNTVGTVYIVANSGRRCWFEGRIRPSNVTNTWAWYFGLGALGQMTTDYTIADGAAGLTALSPHVGFRVLSGDPDGLDIQMSDAAADAIPKELVGPGTLGVITAAAWLNLGIYFNGKTKVEMYVDNVLRSTLSPATAGFPDSIYLSPFIITKAQGTAVTMDMDWWAIASDVV